MSINIDVVYRSIYAKKKEVRKIKEKMCTGSMQETAYRARLERRWEEGRETSERG